jgi:hypothetical protein
MKIILRQGQASSPQRLLRYGGKNVCSCKVDQQSENVLERNSAMRGKRNYGGGGGGLITLLK